MNIKFFLLLSSLTLITPAIFGMEHAKPITPSAKIIHTLNFILQMGPSLALLSHSKPKAKIIWKTNQATTTKKQEKTTLLYTVLLESIQLSSFPSEHNKSFKFLIPLDIVSMIKGHYKNYYQSKWTNQSILNNPIKNPLQESLCKNKQVINSLHSSWQTKAFYGLGGIGLFATGWLGKTWWDSLKL